MIGYPFLNELFTNVLSKSKAIEGRFFLCPKMGREINSDELDQALKDIVFPNPLAKKYPLSLGMPPVISGDYTERGNRWERVRGTILFLNTTFYSSTGQVMEPNKATGTSTHTIIQDWHDMKRAAVNFVRVLDKLQRKRGLGVDKFRIEDYEQQITPVSLIGIDRVSGVRLDYTCSLYVGCDLEDYQEVDIANIEIPSDDSHPEHQL